MRSAQTDIWFNYEDKINNKIPSSQPKNNPLLPVIVQYDSIGKKLVSNYRNILKENDIFKQYRLISAFKNHTNLAQMLIRSKLQPEQISENFDHRCMDANCKTCHIILRHSNSFKSNNTGKIFKIYQQMNCKSKNTIYLISCTKCGFQYVGETSQSLAYRMTQHRSTIKIKNPTPVGLHFNESDHSIHNITVQSIEIVENVTKRRKQEEYWQRILNTKYPNGMNCMTSTILFNTI
jgi:predicted RNA-binding Zn-ribbon protein involved in translation (DUF1610 family)